MYKNISIGKVQKVSSVWNNINENTKVRGTISSKQAGCYSVIYFMLMLYTKFQCSTMPGTVQKVCGGGVVWCGGWCGGGGLCLF